MTSTNPAAAPAASGYRLPDSRCACPWCGTSVPKPADPALIETRTLWQTTPAGQRHAWAEVEMTLCPTCSLRHAMAARIAESHPRAAASLGPDIALERIEAALTALALLGQPLPAEDCPDAHLGVLLRHLASPAQSLAYRTRAVPAVSAPHAWGHLADDDLAHLRQGWAGVLAERVAATSGDARLRPPPLDPDDAAAPGMVAVPGACLLCGVATVRMSAQRVLRHGGRERAAEQVWEPLTCTASSLGGIGPDTVTGHVCPPCQDAIGAVGAVGPSALERSLVAHLAPDAPPTGPEGPPEITGLRGFAALATDADRAGRRRPPPGARPWQHVPDRERLAAELRAATTATTGAS